MLRSILGRIAYVVAGIVIGLAFTVRSISLPDTTSYQINKLVMKTKNQTKTITKYISRPAKGFRIWTLADDGHPTSEIAVDKLQLEAIYLVLVHDNGLKTPLNGKIRIFKD